MRPVIDETFSLEEAAGTQAYRKGQGIGKIVLEYLKLTPRSLVVTGAVSEWEEWTGMCFPESGSYVVPGALQPVRIDLERDEGRYEDLNVWMRHPIAENIRSTT